MVCPQLNMSPQQVGPKVVWNDTTVSNSLRVTLYLRSALLNTIHLLKVSLKVAVKWKLWC